MNPRVVPRVTTEAVDEKTTKIHVVAATKEEAENCLRKTLARKHLKPEEQERLLAQAPNSTEEVSYVPHIRYEREMDWNRFYMEALKIGYEYAVCVLEKDTWKTRRPEKSEASCTMRSAENLSKNVHVQNKWVSFQKNRKRKWPNCNFPPRSI